MIRLKLLFLILIVCSFSASAQKKQPNIIFVMADDLGWGELGAYGNTFNETPNLDRLASEGVKFDKAYAAAPNCSPTRASIMTGQYPARVRITDYLPEAEKTHKWLDPAKHITLNEALSAAGYYTGIVGKWHLDTHFDTDKGGPKAHGFDEVIGSETKYIADGDYFYPYDKISTFKTGIENEYLTDRQSQEAVKFIERNKDQPFFLYLSYYSVHTKLEAKEDLINKYKRKFDEKYGSGAAEKLYGPHNPNHMAPHKDNPYLGAMLESIDIGMGEIMQSLKKNKLEENTLLIFFSDNGGAGRGANNGNLRASKMWLYEGGIRVPLIMRLPSTIKAGTVETTSVSSIDFYPTFLELAGGVPSKDQLLDGRSLAPLYQGRKLDRDALYWHYPSETARLANNMATAVQKDGFKLIKFYANKRTELYNLQLDRGETKDLSSEMPAKTAELSALIESWKREVNAEEPIVSVKNAKKKQTK